MLSCDELSRFAPGGNADPGADVTLAWELLYRLEPELYDRLVSAERLHPGVLNWLPRHADRIVEVGAGAGRLTLELAGRGREVVAIEPAGPLRQHDQGRQDEGGDHRRGQRTAQGQTAQGDGFVQEIADGRTKRAGEDERRPKEGGT